MIIKLLFIVLYILFVNLYIDELYKFIKILLIHK